MTTATVHIRKLDAKNKAQLYCRYYGQNSPQPCYIALDLESGEMYADYNPNIGGGMGMREWHGIVRTWVIPVLRASAANELMEEIADLAQQVLDGGEVVWDGNNYVGRLDDDARGASDSIENMLLDAEGQLEVWDAESYYAGLGDQRAQAEYLGITAATTDDELAAIVTKEESCPEGEVDLVTGVADHLSDLRDHMRDSADLVED